MLLFYCVKIVTKAVNKTVVIHCGCVIVLFFHDQRDTETPLVLKDIMARLLALAFGFKNKTFYIKHPVLNMRKIFEALIKNIQSMLGCRPTNIL